jgi:hypothetical protein
MQLSNRDHLSTLVGREIPLFTLQFILLTGPYNRPLAPFLEFLLSPFLPPPSFLEIPFLSSHLSIVTVRAGYTSGGSPKPRE